MKLVQKILSHGLLIAFIVAAFFIYMNRINLFPQWFAKPAPASVSHTQVTPGTSDTAAAEVAVPEAGGQAQAPSPVEVETVEVETAPVVPESTAAVSEPEVVAVEADTVIVAPAAEKTAAGGVSGDTSEPVSAAAAEPEPVQQEPVQQDSATGDVAPAFRPLTETETPEVAPSAGEEEAGSQQAAVGATPEQMPGSKGEQIVTESEAAGNEPAATQQAEVMQETAAPSDYQQQLELARAHFWERDIPAALQVYQTLAETWPERAEVWGEMGNLYFTIRKKPEAMDAYARAIKLLTEQGDATRARALLDVMYRLDARRASQLEMSLRQTGG